MIAILASQNKHKLQEFNGILEKHDLQVIARDDTCLPKDDVEETGTTLEANSLIKAQTIRDMIVNGGYEEYMNAPVLADDSGLMVDALNGAPGVYSSRYAGENPTFEDNNNKLLSELASVPYEKRTAQFVTVITMIYPDGTTLVAKGVCPGHIAETKLGEGGFGYDPVFIPEGYDQSFSQLGTDFKNTISHRALALAELERQIEG